MDINPFNKCMGSRCYDSLPQSTLSAQEFSWTQLNSASFLSSIFSPFFAAGWDRRGKMFPIDDLKWFIVTISAAIEITVD